MKYYSFLIALFLLFVPLELNALTAEEYAETVDIFDVYHVPVDDNDFYEVGFIPRSFNSINEHRYEKDESMKVSSMQWFRYFNGNMNGSSNFVFGSYVTYNPDNVLYFYIKNNGQPLFNEGGTLGLEVVTRGRNCYVSVTRTDGSISKVAIPDYILTEVVTYVTFDNSYADIVEICLYVGNLTDTYTEQRIYGSFLDYGYYIGDDEEVEPDPEPIVPVVSGDINGSLEFLLNFVIQFTESLFILELIKGVSFGNFILATLILSVVFAFLYNKLVR